MSGLLYRHAVKHPLRSVALALAATFALAPGLALLELRTDGQALVPQHAAEVAEDRRTRDEFGIDDPIVVLIRTRDASDIFTATSVRLIRRLTDALQQAPFAHPDGVTSLATEKGDRVLEGTLDFLPLLTPLPTTDADLRRLRADLEAIAIHMGTVVARDGSAAAIFVGVPRAADRAAVYDEIRAVVEPFRGGDLRLDVIGAPVAEALLGTHILQDLGVPSRLLGPAVRRDPADPSARALPASLHELRGLLGRHVGLVPIALLVMAGVFMVGFRRPAAAVLPLIEVGACLTAVFALMGWCGSPIYITTTILPVILVSIGVSDEVHILNRYARRGPARPGEGRAESVLATMREVAPPVMRTSLTTAAAFLAFAISPIPAVRSFGVFAAAGILLCMVWSLGVTPALLTLAPAGWFVRRGVGREGPGVLGRLALAAARGRRWVLGLTGLVVLAAPFGVLRIAVQDGWISGFAPRSAFRQATEWFDDHFLGTHLLLVRIDAPPTLLRGEVAADAIDHHRLLLPTGALEDPRRMPGARIRLIDPGRPEVAWESWVSGATPAEGGVDVRFPASAGSPVTKLAGPAGTVGGGRAAIGFEVKRLPLLLPETIRRLEGLEQAIEALPLGTVGGVRGPYDYLSTTNFIAWQRAAGSRSIPDRPDRLRWLWDRLETIRGPVRFRQLVNEDASAAVLTVFLRGANYADTARVMQAIRDYEGRHLAAHGIRLHFAGDVAVSQALIEAVVATQVRSLLLSLAVIVLLLAWFQRSLGWGLLTVVPCALAVLLNFAAMGWVGIPLGVATSMFAGMILGIGVDYAIHLIHRYRHGRASGAACDEAIVRAADATGPAILIDGGAIALGFAVLTLSQVPANARLGLLAIVCIASCVTASLVILPALLRATDREAG